MRTSVTERPHRRRVPLSPIRTAVMICTCFSAVCFVAYLFSVISHAGTVFSYSLPIVLCALILVPPCTESFWEAKLPAKLFRAGKAVYSFCVIFFTVSFLCLLFALSSFECTSPTVTDDTVVLVYGCRVKGEEPGQMLAERLDCAIALLRQNPASRVIVSGALDEGEIHTEGQVMAWYLEEHGIDASRIYIDETAESTKGNIRGFLALAEEHGMADAHFISVSSSFHMPRIAFLCEKYGLSSDFVGAKTASFSLRFPSVVREYLAYVKMILLNNYT